MIGMTMMRSAGVADKRGAYLSLLPCPRVYATCVRDTDSLFMFHSRGRLCGTA